MKLNGNWVGIGVIGAVFLASCFDPPEYGPIPEIIFDNIVLKDIADPSIADSLIISVKFKDGDGDLGIDPSETAEPFNDKYYYQLSGTKYLPVTKLTNSGTFITYKNQRTNHNNHTNDTLPSFTAPANCIHWEITTLNNKVDTFYFYLNPNHYNIFVDFYIKNSDGTYKEFDWTKEFVYPNCGITFDGRFPILSKDLSRKTPLDGTIRYAMQSTGFTVLFSIKTLNLKVTIQDRHLHKSNIVETKDFRLQDIRKSG